MNDQTSEQIAKLPFYVAEVLEDIIPQRRAIVLKFIAALQIALEACARDTYGEPDDRENSP